MKPRPSSSTTSFMLIATDSVTSSACAGLTTPRSSRTTGITRIRIDMARIVPVLLTAYQNARLGITTASQALHTDVGQCMTHAVPDDLRRRADSPPGLRRRRRSASDGGTAAFAARPGRAPERDGLDPTGRDVLGRAPSGDHAGM